MTESTAVDAGAETGALGEGKSRGDQQSIDPPWPAAAPKGPTNLFSQMNSKNACHYFFHILFFFV